jgi:hypothetical protein
MSVRLRKTTPRDLFFEDVLMPRWAHEIDILPISVLGDLNFRFSHWFFRFSVCAGRVRRSPTFAIRCHCKELLDVIHRRREEILLRIPIRSGIKDCPNEVLDQWTTTLKKMIELSAGKKSCTWYADAHPSDPLWPGSAAYLEKLEARAMFCRTEDREQAIDRALKHELILFSRRYGMVAHKA